MKTLLINTYNFSSKVIKLSTRPSWLEPEPLTKENKTTQSEKALVILIHCEDKSDINQTNRLLSDIYKMLRDTGRKNVILCPFGHLSNKPGPKKILLEIMEECSTQLKQNGYLVKKVHFGSHKTLDWNWCGHPAAVRFRSYKTTHFYTEKQYIANVEKNEYLQKFQAKERAFIISKILTNNHQQIIDIGAGYGRVYCSIKKHLNNKKYLGIETNQNMYTGLINKLNPEKNHHAYFSEFQKMTLNSPKESSLLVCAQNTLGVVEGGIDSFLLKIKKILENEKSNLILSVFKKESLKTTGISMYQKMSNMIGEVSHKNSDIQNGIIRTNLDYTSKWFSKEDLKSIAKKCNREIEINEYRDFFLCYL